MTTASFFVRKSVDHPYFVNRPNAIRYRDEDSIRVLWEFFACAYLLFAVYSAGTKAMLLGPVGIDANLARNTQKMYQ